MSVLIGGILFLQTASVAVAHGGFLHRFERVQVPSSYSVSTSPAPIIIQPASTKEILIVFVAGSTVTVVLTGLLIYFIGKGN